MAKPNNIDVRNYSGSRYAPRPSDQPEVLAKLNAPVRVRFAPDLTSPLQQPSADNRPRFAFPGATETSGGGGGGGGGIPDGYAEELFTICEDGTPVDVYLLVRRIT